jgi:hypothetical protein
VAVFDADNADVKFYGLMQGYTSEFPMYVSDGHLYCAFRAVLIAGANLSYNGYKMDVVILSILQDRMKSLSAEVPQIQCRSHTATVSQYPDSVRGAHLRQ